MDLILYKQNQLKALSNSVLIKEYIKKCYIKGYEHNHQEHLIRIYKKFEKINRQEKEVYYFVVYLGTNPILNNVINFERTSNKKRINQVIKHIENLK